MSDTDPGSSGRPGPAPRSDTSLRDVARLAGVSPSTASRVVSGSTHPVSAEARARVLAAATQLGFEPNRLARALATARSQTIGALVHDVADPYFAQIIRGLEEAIADSDHALFVASSDRDPKLELACLRAFLSHRVDAVVLAASGIADTSHLEEMTEMFDQYLSRGGFVVSMSENAYPAPGIRIDNRAVAAMATDHLIELGHRHIAYVAGPSELLVNQVRLAGFRHALEAAGIPFHPERVLESDFTLAGGRAVAAAVLADPELTGIVAANDLMAIGAMRGLLDLGIAVPEEMSVVGIDDIDFTEYAPVPLTTVHIPLTEFGVRGGRMVMDLIRGGEPRSLVMPHRLVRRHSSAPPPR